MRPSNSLSNICVYRKPVDFRKWINGLSVIVEHELSLSALSGQLFVFFNRARNKVRLLFWEKNGFVVYSKQLEEDKFILPHANADSVVITGEQLNWLLDGLNINLLQRHQERHYQHSM